MTILLSKEYAQAYVDEGRSLGVVKWTKKTVVTFAEYQTVYNAIIEFHKKKPQKFFIADVREQGVMPPAYRKWFQEYVMVEAVKYGLKKAVVIFDGNVFKKYYLNHILNTGTKFGLPITFVNTTEEAEKWLKESI